MANANRGLVEARGTHGRDPLPGPSRGAKIGARITGISPRPYPGAGRRKSGWLALVWDALARTVRDDVAWRQVRPREVLTLLEPVGGEVPLDVLPSGNTPRPGDHLVALWDGAEDELQGQVAAVRRRIAELEG